MSSSIDFTDQVAVVTGAGRSLGRTYALDLASRGAHVVVNDRGTDADGSSTADRVAAEIRDLGGSATSNLSDLATSKGAEELAQAALELHGRVDVAVCNAGFLRPGLVADVTDEHLREILDVHLAGYFYLARAVWPTMQSQGYGRIVLTGSSASLGQAGNSNYVAAKAGVLGLARALAAEAGAADIRANCILPYARSEIVSDSPLVGEDADRIMTLMRELTPRRGQESVSPMVMYLASQACRVNGEAYSALAGRYSRVFMGLTQGWMVDEIADATPESIAANLDSIRDTGTFLAPSSMLEEIEDVAGRLRG